MSEKRSVVITGVSTGIGKACVELMIQKGWRVFGSVRKQADADRLESDLGKGSFVPLIFDVTNPEAIRAAAAQVEEALGGRGLDGLVNNAGVAFPGPLMHIPLEEMRQQFEINLFGVLAVTQAFLPLLGAKLPQTNPPGRIVNMSSQGGKIAAPFLGPYVASKHALEGLSDSLRRELMIYGVDVIVIEPGAIKTPIWDKAEDANKSPYEGTDYVELLERFQQAMIKRGRNGLPVERVAEAVRSALESRKPKTRYVIPDMPVQGWLLPRYLPDRWVDKLIASRFNLKLKK
jgi:NAD(P)-dependent dehydrogenase (short-subunit alcohol dehydrogenase family)